nr:histidine kinase [Auritidibacter ignavus]
MAASSLIVARPGTFAAEFVGQLITAAAFAAVGIATRSVRAWRSSSRRVRTALAQAQHFEYERDEAIVWARIAEELHDSVGHGLTTIAALAEGLSGVTGDAQFDEALDGINQVARESLEDTRRAVHRLSAAAHVSEGPDVALIETGATVDAGNGESRSRYRHWDDIVPILDHVRSLGVTVIFTETGRRQEHREHSHLCFSITRESLTNAIRHAACLKRVTVSWDHSEKATRITVRNDGVERSLPPSAGSQYAPGTGLRRLQRQVEQTGGSLSSGYEDGADWVLVSDVLVPDKEVGHP